MTVFSILRAGALALIGLGVLAFLAVFVSGLAQDGRMSARLDRAVAVDRVNAPTAPAALPDDLPAPLQRLAARLSPEARAVIGVRMRLEGDILLPGTDTWRSIRGAQYISAVSPSFLWTIQADAGPLWVDVTDHYTRCEGSILTRGYGLLPVMNERGVEELSITQMVRWSGLLAMVPQALLTHPAITWDPIDDTSARATIRDCDLVGRQVFHFDADGNVIRTESRDRYELFPGKGYLPTGSIMHRTAFEVIDGISIPTEATIIRIEDGTPVEFLRERFFDIETVRAAP